MIFIDNNEIKQIYNLDQENNKQKWEAFFIPTFTVYFLPFHHPVLNKIWKIEVNFDHIFTYNNYQQKLNQKLKNVYFQYELNENIDNTCRGSVLATQEAVLTSQFIYFQDNSKKRRKLLFPEKCLNKNNFNVLHYNFVSENNDKNYWYIDKNNNIGSLIFKIKRNLDFNLWKGEGKEIEKLSNSLVISTYFPKFLNNSISTKKLVEEKISFTDQVKIAPNLFPLIKINHELFFDPYLFKWNMEDIITKIKYFYNNFDFEQKTVGNLIFDKNIEEKFNFYNDKKLNFHLKNNNLNQNWNLFLTDELSYNLNKINEINVNKNKKIFNPYLLLPNWSAYNFLLNLTLKLTSFSEYNLNFFFSLKKEIPNLGDKKSLFWFEKKEKSIEFEIEETKEYKIPYQKMIHYFKKSNFELIDFYFLKKKYLIQHV
jgi:hypothetical protein